MDKATKKILKAARRNYSFLIMIFFIMAMNVWEYETKGYTWVYSHRFFGEDARTITWLPFLFSLGFLIYYTLILFMRTGTKEERKRYANRLPEDPRNLICVQCCEVIVAESYEQIFSCPYCGSTEIEQLQGFFERHPDKKDRPSFTSQSGKHHKPKPLRMEIP